MQASLLFGLVSGADVLLFGFSVEFAVDSPEIEEPDPFEDLQL